MKDELKDILDFIANLNDPKHYPKDDNDQRTSFITLSQTFAKYERFTSEDEKYEVLMGLLISEYKLIEKEYHESWLKLSPERSLLYRNIKPFMDQLDQNRKLVYIDKLYQYVEKTFDYNVIPKSEIKHAIWKIKDGLLADIYAMRNAVVVDNIDNIDALLERMPVLDVLKQYINAMHDKYVQAKQNGLWANPKRIKLLNFVDFITKTSDAKLENNVVQHLAVLSALALFVFMKIESEYSFFKPEGGWFNRGSELYKISKAVKRFDKFHDDTKIDILTALLSHIAVDVMRDEKLLEKQLSKDFTEKDLHEYLNILKEMKYNLEKKQRSHSKTRKVASSIATNTVQAGLATFAVAEAITLAPAILGFAGAGGLVIMMGGIVFTVAGPFAKKLVSNVGGKIVDWGLHKGSEVLGEGIVGMAAAAVYKKSHPAQRRILSKDDDIAKRWIEVLLRLPESALAAEKKERIRFVTNMNDEHANKDTIDVASLRVGF